MHKYRIISRKGEGTFSQVLKAQATRSGEYVAIKRMRGRFNSVEQVNGLREIQALRRLTGHPNVITLKEVLYDRKLGRLALVFELMDLNLYELIRNRRHFLTEQRIRHFAYCLLRALDYTHRSGIFHRDIKPENILISASTLKLADYGSCRGIYTQPPYTEYISTRWYRSPECLLTDGHYSFKMDIWGAACVLFELAALFPLFPGRDEVDQARKIHEMLGEPSTTLLEQMANGRRSKVSKDIEAGLTQPTLGETDPAVTLKRLVPHLSDTAIDLIAKMLAYNADDRITARQALKHPWFASIRHSEVGRSSIPPSVTTSPEPDGRSKKPGQGRRRKRRREKQHETEQSGTLPTIGAAVRQKPRQKTKSKRQPVPTINSRTRREPIKARKPKKSKHSRIPVISDAAPSHSTLSPTSHAPVDSTIASSPDVRAPPSISTSPTRSLPAVDDSKPRQQQTLPKISGVGSLTVSPGIKAFKPEPKRRTKRVGGFAVGGTSLRLNKRKKVT